MKQDYKEECGVDDSERDDMIEREKDEKRV
jgi:hypothetical protein